MSPRKYAMHRRDELAAETRRRIVESTLGLHSENGIFGTSWKAIAERADVSVGTVYKHFPNLDELLPACGALMMERYSPPQPEDAADLMGPSDTPDQRLAAVATAIFDFYDRAGPAAEVDPRERKLVAIQEWEAYWSATVGGFVKFALAPLRPNAKVVAVAGALLDQRTYAALMARGLTATDAASEITQMIMAWLNGAGLHHHRRRKAK